MNEFSRLRGNERYGACDDDMPPKKHAILSASSSHRWLTCNPSARLEQEFEDRNTEAAEEGTAAHALAEHKLRKALKMRSTRPVSKFDSDEMEAYTDGYVEFVLEVLEEAKQQCKDPLVMIEQRLDFSCYVPDGFGTGDCLIVADHVLHIIDFKYGIRSLPSFNFCFSSPRTAPTPSKESGKPSVADQIIVQCQDAGSRYCPTGYPRYRERHIRSN